ncbi:hypothetical protein [Arthrobacter sp. ISL-69]|uniref:hypothetical protein n=1 Tax=Arthrobacter sp. ISL-69 TaxID=2819113 RepID=UPI001BE50C72|nr:hypothetical protein [Arthrobacter sp. ISL-69]MBT2537193.1 hypothetical protein [Arthrobacter sp. ISL-69]
MTFTFPAAVAWDPIGKQAVKNTSFQAFATADTGFVTPLTITDTFGNPIPGNILNSGTQGVFPEFENATNPTVVITDPSRTYVWTVTAVMADASVAAFVGQSGSSTKTAVKNAITDEINDPTSPARVSLSATYAGLIQLAKNPDTLIAGAVTVDGSDLVTSAAVLWPDGSPGTLTITARHATGAVNAYNITYGSPVTKTFTQPTITRNSNGAATNVPQIVVS